MDIKTVNKNLEMLELVEVVAKAYAQISSGKMRAVKDSVLLNRDFTDSLNNVFEEARGSYRQGKLTFVPKNGKTVSVFLGANTGLYGDLMRNVFNAFAKDVKDEGSEATIIGKLGLKFFLETFPDEPYTYFDLPSKEDKDEVLTKIGAHLVSYSEIHIYYGQFKSLISQVPAMKRISSEEALQGTAHEKIENYFFEPSIEEVLIFFEKEMFNSLLDESFSEGELAKEASRLLAMEKASERIKENLIKARRLRLQKTHYLENKKQTNLFASFNLW